MPSPPHPSSRCRRDDGRLSLADVELAPPELVEVELREARIAGDRLAHVVPILRAQVAAPGHPFDQRRDSLEIAEMRVRAMLGMIARRPVVDHEGPVRGFEYQKLAHRLAQHLRKRRHDLAAVEDMAEMLHPGLRLIDVPPDPLAIFAEPDRVIVVE